MNHIHQFINFPQVSKHGLRDNSRKYNFIFTLLKQITEISSSHVSQAESLFVVLRTFLFPPASAWNRGRIPPGSLAKTRDMFFDLILEKKLSECWNGQLISLQMEKNRSNLKTFWNFFEKPNFKKNYFPSAYYALRML